MCRSKSEGQGRRCPGCTPGSPEFRAAHNERRRANRRRDRTRASLTRIGVDADTGHEVPGARHYAVTVVIRDDNDRAALAAAFPDQDGDSAVPGVNTHAAHDAGVDVIYDEKNGRVDWLNNDARHPDATTSPDQPYLPGHTPDTPDTPDTVSGTAAPTAAESDTEGPRHVVAPELTDDDYRMMHQAPYDDSNDEDPYYGNIATGLDERFPDWKQHPDYYDAADDPETMTQLRSLTGDPEQTVRIYRALPDEHSQINPRDWVTLSREYAEGHAAAEGWGVVAADVPASHVHTDGNSLQEFGYDPGNNTSIAGLRHYREGEDMPAPGAMTVPSDAPPATVTGTPASSGEPADSPYPTAPTDAPDEAAYNTPVTVASARYGDFHLQAGVLNDESRAVYKSGQCYAFAKGVVEQNPGSNYVIVATNSRTPGWERNVNPDDPKTWSNDVSHVYAQTPDGRLWDVDGPHTAAEAEAAAREHANGVRLVTTDEKGWQAATRKNAPEQNLPAARAFARHVLHQHASAPAPSSNRPDWAKNVPEGMAPGDEGPVTFTYLRNPNSMAAGHGNTTGFGQTKEPTGRYMNAASEGQTIPDGWQTGQATFNNPLRVPFGGGYDEPDNWKNELSARYGRKTGERLSRAIAADGYDGIVTSDKYGASEIVDLRSYAPKSWATAKDAEADLKDRYPGVDLRLHDSSGYVIVDMVKLDKSERGKGTGSRIMGELKDWADQNKRAIALTPESPEGGPKAPLVRFYSRFGFKPNKGSSRDMRIRETYRYIPEGAPDPRMS